MAPTTATRIKPVLKPASPECTVKNDFGTRQTHYLTEKQLLSYLRMQFPTIKEFGAEVARRTVSVILDQDVLTSLPIRK